VRPKQNGAKLISRKVTETLAISSNDVFLNTIGRLHFQVGQVSSIYCIPSAIIGYWILRGHKLEYIYKLFVKHSRML